MTTILFEDQLEIPLNIDSLSSFRRWVTSENAPQRGRIDFIEGRIEVDMSPEDLFSHGTLKVEIVGVLFQRVKQLNSGHLFSHGCSFRLNRGRDLHGRVAFDLSVRQ